MGLKSLGMIYLSVLDNQETITRRKRKRSNQGVAAQARELPFSSSPPGAELCQMVGVYEKGNVRAFCNHAEIPGCEKQSPFIYGQALARTPVTPAQLLLATSVKRLLLLYLRGGRFCFPHFTDKNSKVARDHTAKRWRSRAASRLQLLCSAFGPLPFYCQENLQDFLFSAKCKPLHGALPLRF